MEPYEYQLSHCTATELYSGRENLSYTFAFQEPYPRVLCCDARILHTQIQTQEGLCRVSGDAEMHLFSTAGGVMSVQTVKLPFRISIPGEGLGNAVLCRCRCHPVRLHREEDGNYRAECAAEASVRGFGSETRTVLRDVEARNPEIKKAQIVYMKSENVLRTEVSAQEDVLLEATLPEVGEILLLEGSAEFDECRCQAGEAQLEGRLHCRMLYRAKDTGDPVTAHFSLPLSGTARCADWEEGGTPCVLPAETEVTARVYPDVQGEDRLLRVTALCQADLTEAVSESCTLVCDAFCTDRELNLTKQETTIALPPKIRVETVSIHASADAQGEPPEKILYTLARLQTQTLNSDGARAHWEGELSAQLLYLDASGGSRVMNFTLPVQNDFAVSCLRTDAEPLDVNLDADFVGGRWEFTGTARFAVCEYPARTENFVTSAQEGEEIEAPEWGLMLLVAGPEDTLWSLAERSRVKLDTLRDCNPELKDRDPRPGEALIVTR